MIKMSLSKNEIGEDYNKKLFAITFNRNTADVIIVPSKLNLMALDRNEITGIIKSLSANSSSWENVLYGRQLAILFDPEKYEVLTINGNLLPD